MNQTMHELRQKRFAILIAHVLMLSLVLPLQFCLAAIDQPLEISGKRAAELMEAMRGKADAEAARLRSDLYRYVVTPETLVELEKYIAAKDYGIRGAAIGLIERSVLDLVRRQKAASARVAVPTLLKIPLVQSDDTFDNMTLYLGHIEDERALPALVERLEDHRGGVRRSAASAFLMMGKNNAKVAAQVEKLAVSGSAAAQEALASSLKDHMLSDENLNASILKHTTASSAPEVKLSALLTMRELQRQGYAFSFLPRMNADDSAKIKALVVQVLAQRGAAGDEAVPLLMSLLKHKNAGVKTLAVEALGELGENAAAAVPLLISSLQNNKPHTTDSAVLERELILTLGEIGPGAATSLPLLRSLKLEDHQALLHRSQLEQAISNIEEDLSGKYFPPLAFGPLVLPNNPVEHGEPRDVYLSVRHRRLYHRSSAEAAAKNLKRLGCPPLLGNSFEGTTVLRLLHCGSWNECEVLKIEKPKDELPSMTQTRCARKGLLGIYACERTRRLSAENWQRIEESLKVLNFYALSGDSREVSGFDGETYTVEVLGPDGYHAVRRWSPEAGQFLDFVRAVDSLKPWPGFRSISP